MGFDDAYIEKPKDDTPGTVRVKGTHLAAGISVQCAITDLAPPPSRFWLVVKSAPLARALPFTAKAFPTVQATVAKISQYLPKEAEHHHD